MKFSLNHKLKVFLEKYHNHITWYGVIFGIILIGQMIFFAMYLWSLSSPITSAVQQSIDSLKFLWLISFPYVIFNLIGLLLGPPKKPKPNLNDQTTKKIILRISYCTRGQNYLSLKRSLSSVARVLNQKVTVKNKKIHLKDLFKNVEVEAITDKKLPKITFPKSLKNITHFETLVPKNYHTQNSTKYKARSLHYSTTVNLCAPNIWVLRLDEESKINTDTIKGIIEFLQNRQDTEIIAQGEILYNAYQYANKITITAADAIRTGDDLGRFRLQYKMHKNFFGMHGSFILIRSDIEKKYGYDYGLNSSITEDAYLALKIIDNGWKFGWLNGNIQEQSPYSFSDFIKQRKRWFVGLTYVVRDKRIHLKHRLTLMLSRIMWAVSWTAFLITVLNIIFPSETNIWIAQIGGLIFSIYILIYLLGTARNLQGKKLGTLARSYMYILTIICIPLSTMLEAIGVISGMINSTQKFEIVKKN
ncbi:glycosyltransferase [Candidatus Peregrinibacteria bacterium]|nr:glycosyltransferase [Candidatus Peregrinibacteria bacterium]